MGNSHELYSKQCALDGKVAGELPNGFCLVFLCQGVRGGEKNFFNTISFISRFVGHATGYHVGGMSAMLGGLIAQFEKNRGEIPKFNISL